jgi:hypothetical protein
MYSKFTCKKIGPPVEAYIVIDLTKPFTFSSVFANKYDCASTIGKLIRLGLVAPKLHIGIE